MLIEDDKAYLDRDEYLPPIKERGELKLLHLSGAVQKQVEILVQKSEENTEYDPDQFEAVVNFVMSTFPERSENGCLKGHLYRTQENLIVLGDLMMKYSDKLPEWEDLLTKKHLNQIALWSPLHDIGKSKIPEAIMHKVSPFTPEEWTCMKTHVVWGGVIGKDLKVPVVAQEMIETHHESWDGTKNNGLSIEKLGGYPNNLKGYGIPMAGQMMGIIDWLDGYSSKRIYKDACCEEDVICELLKLSGKKFNPLLVDLILENYDKFIFQEEGDL